jgi:predicted cupin superfamily sugar epimerase
MDAGRPRGRQYSTIACCSSCSSTIYPMSLPYPYPISNSDLLKVHNLESHFEGGFFKQTVALSSRLENGKRVQESSGSATDWLQNAPTTSSTPNQAMDATCIYYLITPEFSRGRMHMNNNAVRSATHQALPKLTVRHSISTTPVELSTP